MVSKRTNSVDVHVGNRIRMRRLIVSISQEKLGESLGISFQQVQKYEKGKNRVGAGRLYQIARTLGVDVNFFFDSLDEMAADNQFSEDQGSDFVVDIASTHEGIKLMRSFSKIQDPLIRRRLMDLVEALSERKRAADFSF